MKNILGFINKTYYIKLEACRTVSDCGLITIFNTIKYTK